LKRRASHARIVTVLVAASVLVGGVGCDGERKPAADEVAMAGQPVKISRLQVIAAGICDAAQLAGRSIDSARATFYGQSHEGLHLIARGLEALDRAAAATLLEAKQKVESDFLDRRPASQLTDDLRRLADVTRSSLARFEVTADACSP
jgi:hypothetical protein